MMEKNDLNDIQAAVITGMRIMYDPEMLPDLRAGLAAPTPMPVKLATQIAGLMKSVDDKTPNGIPPKAVAPAAKLLTMDMMQFIYQIGGPKPSEDVMAKTTPILKKLLVEIFTKHGKGVKARQPVGEASPPAGGNQPAMAADAQRQAMPQPRGLLAAPQGA